MQKDIFELIDDNNNIIELFLGTRPKQAAGKAYTHMIKTGCDKLQPIIKHIPRKNFVFNYSFLVIMPDNNFVEINSVINIIYVIFTMPVMFLFYN